MVLSALNQSLSFHASPESFITSRLQQLAVSDPHLLPSGAEVNKVVEASILNRKVHIVSSYQLCKDLLNLSSSPSPDNLTPETVRPATVKARKDANADSDPQLLETDSVVANPAYHQLMADFFTPPNLLLADGDDHRSSKKSWTDQLATFPADTAPRIRKIADEHLSPLFRRPATATGAGADTIDLYESLKSLSWKVLLGVFLDLSTSDQDANQGSEFSQMENLQELLLRGQFSLFPVSINARFWQSPRSKGIQARKELQSKLAEIVDRQDAGCPFLKQAQVTRDDAARHAIMFTSSIAVKGLASLLTALVLNLFLWRDPNEADQSSSLVDLIHAQPTPEKQESLLASILSETERLSPPVVGVMRRNCHPLILTPDPSKPKPNPHPVPANHDIWLYLSGASRDPTIFGATCHSFQPTRYQETPPNSPSSAPFPPPHPLCFATGPKTCLGAPLIRSAATTIATSLLALSASSAATLHADVRDPGVRIWLGWDGGDWGAGGSGAGAEGVVQDAQKVAAGMKQLPVQRPREKIGVRIVPSGG